MTRFSSSTASAVCSGGSVKRLRQLLADVRLWADKLAELRLFLQRRFWSPLRGTMQIFHVLPLAAVVILFALLATDGQFREIYIAYLEQPSNGFAPRLGRIAAALVAMSLISAVLFHAHNALSAMRLKAAFASGADARVESNLPRLQRAAGFVLAFLPWLGLTVGLFGAREFVVARRELLGRVAAQVAGSSPPHQWLAPATGIESAAALVLLGMAAALFAGTDDRNRTAHWAVAWLAPLLAGVLFLLFTDRLGAPDWLVQPPWVYALVAGATGIYVAAYYRLYHRRSGSLLMRLLVRTGVGFRKRRCRRLVLWALLPWLALAAYFAIFAGASAPSGAPLPASKPVWSIFPLAMCCTLAIGVLVAHLLLRLGSSRRQQIAVGCAVLAAAAVAWGLSMRDDPALLVAVYRSIGPLATASLQLLFLIATFAGLALLSQQSGFPALTLVVLTIIVCLIFPKYAWLTATALGIACLAFALIAVVSGRIWAALVLLVLIFVGWINIGTINQASLVSLNNFPEKASATSQTHPADKAAAAMSVEPSALDLRTAYLCWLADKGVNVKGQPDSCTGGVARGLAVKGKFPVFIVAVEGGGIYAASAAATFLAQMETLAPGFAEHIFAISGVSGGGIGAAVFQALDQAQHAAAGSAAAASATAAALAKTEDQVEDAATCVRQRAGPSQRGLSARVARIMEDDHLSPVLGAIFPEIFAAPLRRPDALAASFEYSTATQDQAAAWRLCAPFRDHWSAAGAAPALVLNTTWVETGFRVAFAPFRLHNELLDASLYSFLDPGMPDENCPKQDGLQSCPSLMTAAGVSARFPAIMPPLSVVLGSDHSRWNFVDGGYADNSGATTALDLYLLLKDYAPPDDVDLHLVLITSPSLKLENTISGTVFSDTVAPVDAILKVREDLSNDAVARACSEIYRAQMRGQSGASGDCIKYAASSHGGPLQIIEVEDQTYGLSLGWKISKTSLSIIDWILGQPSVCPGDSNKPSGATASTTSGADAPQVQPPAAGSDAARAQRAATTLRDNSCVAQLLADLVQRSPAPGPKSSPVAPSMKDGASPALQSRNSTR